MTSRNLLMGAVLAATGVLLVGQVRGLLADPTVWPPDDFVEYWAAAKLVLDGQNPFDESLLLPLQQQAGRDTQAAIMMWNPPWAMPAVLPLGLLPAREAQLLWLLVHLAVAGFCADRLWLLFGGNPARRWIGWGMGFAFLPTAFALSSGQISLFLLLGAVLFLECVRRAERDRRWEYLAGAATVLVAIKPHLAYLLWVGIGIDALTRGRWRMIVGGAATGLACALIPLAFNPHVWHQYADALANRPPSQWVSPTIGTVLRMIFGAELFRLQFVSVAAGLAWFALYRWQKRSEWNWIEQLPLVLLVSFLTAPYGAWPFDMVLLMPAVFKMVVGALQYLSPSPLAGEGSEQGSPRAGEERVRGNVTPVELLHPSPGGEAPPPSPAPRPAGSSADRAGEKVGEGKDRSPSLKGGGWAVGSSRFTLTGLISVDLGCLLLNLFHAVSFWFIWVSPAMLLLYALHLKCARATGASREVRAAVAA